MYFGERYVRTRKSSTGDEVRADAAIFLREITSLCLLKLDVNVDIEVAENCPAHWKTAEEPSPGDPWVH